MATPSVRDSEWPQYRQTVEDYRQQLKQVKERTRQGVENIGSNVVEVGVSKKTFQAAQTMLPPELNELLKDKQISKAYKKAGTESNQRASAATAWMLAHRGSWHLTQMAWAGFSLGLTLVGCGSFQFRFMN